MIEYLIQYLRTTHKIAVLSRGYKRKSKGFILASSKSTVEDLGDEPLQIYTKFPDVTVAVDANRRNGISMLQEHSTPDIILLDDAFQHRKVKANFNILLTAYGKLYCDDWYLPTGNLRDSRREARRANIIVVTKCPPTISDDEQVRIRKKLKPQSDQQLLFSSLKYENRYYGKDNYVSLADLKEKKVTLVTGIADPDPLLRHLEEQGLSFEHLAYNDHHFFTEKQLKALNEKQLVLTTEKDYMRLKNKVDALYFIGIQHEFLGNDSETMAVAIDALMK